MDTVAGLVLFISGVSGYGECPGSWATYIYSGEMEQWKCNGKCQSVSKPCQDSLQCQEGDWETINFQLWNDTIAICARADNWLTCKNGEWGEYGVCEPGSEFCQPKEIPCGGQCLKTYQWWKCSTVEQCVELRAVCNGVEPVCLDGSDQSRDICENITLWGDRGCTTEFSAFQLGFTTYTNKCTKERPGQCYEDVLGMDCLDNSDNLADSKFVRQTKVSTIAVNEKSDVDSIEISELIIDLKPCNVTYTHTYIGGVSGLQCKNKCISFDAWCNPSVDYDQFDRYCELTPNITIDVGKDYLICHNNTFWKDKPCGDFYSERCHGVTPGQCFIEFDKCLDLNTGCSDRSNKVCRINGTYDLYNETFFSGLEICKRDNLFSCDDNSFCLDHKLLCDGNNNCPDGSDESELYCSCPYNLKPEQGPSILHNRDVPSATVSCLDVRYPDLKLPTCAVRCNSRIECLNGEDEEGCKIGSIQFWTATAVIIVAVILFSIFLVHCVGPAIQNKMVDASVPDVEVLSMIRFPNLSYEIGENSSYIIFEYQRPGYSPSVLPKLLTCIMTTRKETRNKRTNGLMKKLMFKLHKEEDFEDKIQIAASLIHAMPTLEEVELKSEDLYNLELAVHKKHKEHAIICIKNNMKTSLDTEAVLKGTNPEMKDLMMINLAINREKAYSLGRRFARNNISVIMAFFQMMFILLDYVKDFINVYIMYNIALDSNTNIQHFFPTFGGQLCLLMTLTVVAPMILFTIYLTVSQSGQELGIREKNGSVWTTFTRFLTFILSPIAPVIVIYQHFLQQIKVIRLQEAITNDLVEKIPIDMAKVRELIVEKKYENRLRIIIYVLKKNELVTEIISQVTIQINLILMLSTSSKSLTVEGYQEIFNDNKDILIINVLLSLKKIIFTNIGLISALKNGFHGTVAKIIKCLYYFLATFVRIGVVTVYFGISIGILGILIHKNSLNKYNPSARNLVYDTKYVNGTLEVFRMSDTYYITEATSLTGLNLQQYYLMFIAMIVLHLIGMWLLKHFCFGASFRKLTWVEKLIHMFHTLTFPEASSDWDSGSVSLEEYGKQWLSYKKETKIMLMIHFVENVAMIIPAVFTSCNVVVYHQSLPYTNEEEKAAYELAWWVRMVAPIVVLIVPLVQWGLILLYNFHGHPWKQILALIYAKSSSQEDFFHDFWRWTRGDQVTYWEAIKQFFSQLSHFRSTPGGLDMLYKDPILVSLQNAPGFDQSLPVQHLQSGFAHE